MKKEKLRKERNKGITLIALVITIIVLLILAGVSIVTLTGDNGILKKANEAEEETTQAKMDELRKLAVMASYSENGELDKEKLIDNLKENGFFVKNNDFPIEIMLDGNTMYVDKKGNTIEPFNAEEWDRTATPEDYFVWLSDIPGEEGYNIIKGYTNKLQNEVKLKIPSRCEKIYGVYNGDWDTDNARSFCSTIKTVEIPNTVTEIGDWAFASCDWAEGRGFDNLETISGASSVEVLGDNAFFNCKKLQYITLQNLTKINGDPDLKRTKWYEIQPDGMVYVGRVAYKYKGNMPTNTNIHLREDTVEVSNYAFYNYVNLKSITIPNSVTSIGVSAFSECTGLSNIIIPNSVTSMGYSPFYNWTSNQTINCRTNIKPEGWVDNWNYQCDANIVWGYTGN